MRRTANLLLLLAGPCLGSRGDSRTSANYALTAEAMDSGGQRSGGGPYALDTANGLASFAAVLLEPEPISAPLGLVPLAGPPVLVRFVGSPALSYTIQWTETLDHPVWHDLPTTATDADGVFQTTDTGTEPVRYYRAQTR